MVYTLAFIKNHDEILLVNREKQPWLGCWNGLGGKIEPGEDKESALIRELEEEAGIIVNKTDLIYKGYMTWSGSKDYLHMFLIHDKKKISTPMKTPEGILDYKKISWILNDNMGVAHNIPYFLENLLERDEICHYHCTFIGNKLIKVEKEEVI